MTSTFFAFVLALFGISLILITLSLHFLKGADQQSEKLSTPARFFLIALRLAIGWHCFVEGMEKITTPGWSSEAYLRESMGPFSGVFRWVAGDRLVEKLTLENDETFPRQLDREWQSYANAFASHYDLTPEQLERARGILEQREKDTLTYLLGKTEEVSKISPFPPPLKMNMTMKQRLEENERLEIRVRASEARFPSSSKDVLAQWKMDKADLSRWRGDLKKSLDGQTDKLKKALEDVLTSEQKQQGPMPEPIGLPFYSWGLLEWSDFLVKWSLVLLGACLMLGILSRWASLAAALLILSFYLAMPPLPGWPESPRLEGHYVLINKTLIEVVALLALACIPTGRWAGLDGLIQFVLPLKQKAKPPLPFAQRVEAVPEQSPEGATYEQAPMG